MDSPTEGIRVQDAGAFASVTVPPEKVANAETYIVARARERIPVEGLTLIFVHEQQLDGQVLVVAIPCFDRPLELGADGKLKRELAELSAEAADAFRGKTLHEGSADASMEF